MYSFRIDSINNYYVGNMLVDREEHRIDAPESFYLARTYLVLFADGGLVWDDFDNIKAKWRPARDEDERIPVFSTGIALRVNLFGAVILEPYFALPFQRQADRTTGTLGYHLSFGGF